ncbi:MAG TPA: asparaginase [Anaerolineaceae bacterium]|jgi:L-asparaginase II
MKPTQCQPVVELTRGRIVESIHFGAIAVVDAHGQLLASCGDPDTVTFLRSSAKPFQALPFIERGGDGAFGLTPREVALICASHAGTDEHVSVVSGIQAKAGVREQDLLCGVHPPFHTPTATRLACQGEALTPNRHNCSGKHTGMVAHARLRGLPTENYIDLEHPIQKSILAAFAEMCDLPEAAVEIGIDGCSAPNYAVPLRSAALAYARLMDPAGQAPERAAACERISAAMTGFPEMVGGPERFDTELMSFASGRILAKAGAEGYQALGLRAGALGPGTPALGVAFKVSDGDLGLRASACVALEVLRQLGAISQQDVEVFNGRAAGPIYNWRRLHVGDMRTGFVLERFPTQSV